MKSTALSKESVQMDNGHPNGKVNPKSEPGLCCNCCNVEFPSTKLILLGSWVSFTALTTYGIQDTVLNIPTDLLQNVTEDSFYHHYSYHIGPTRQSAVWGIVVASLALGAILGALCAIPMAERYGRKFVLLYVANFVVLFGSTAMLAAHIFNAFELVIFGRLLLGFTVGLSTTVLPMYLVELSGTSVRGFIASLHGVANNIAASIGMTLGLPQLLGNENSWGYLLSFQALFSLAALVTAQLCPESPQYLYIKHGKLDEALEISHQYSPDDDPLALKEKWDKEKRLDVTSAANASAPKVATLRKAICLGVAIGASRSFSGVTTWNTYSTMLLRDHGINAHWSVYAGVISQILTIFTSFLNTLFIDRVGRRLCMLGGLACINVIWIAVFLLGALETTVTDKNCWSEYTRLVLLEIAFTVVHPIASANATWFLASELVPESARAMVQGTSIVALWSSYLITAQLYPLISLKLSSFSILVLFLMPSTIIFAFLYLYLPETSSRNFAEIYAELGHLKSWDTNGGNGKMPGAKAGSDPNKNAKDLQKVTEARIKAVAAIPVEHPLLNKRAMVLHK